MGSTASDDEGVDAIASKLIEVCTGDIQSLFRRLSAVTERFMCRSKKRLDVVVIDWHPYAPPRGSA